MKTDIISIDNQGKGYGEALSQTLKAAAFRDLDHKQTLQLRLCTEEMLSLARSVAGTMTGSFWVESEGAAFELRLSAKTVMDAEKRKLLIESASSRKNEAANSFLGRLCDAIEEAMASEPASDIPDEALDDLANHPLEIPEWDKYEQTILGRVADDIKIGIRGGTFDMTVRKAFASA